MTLIVNILGGAGVGKSTMSGSLFGMLKRDGYDVEYVQEFAKKLTWEKNFQALEHQYYVSGTQMYMQNMLNGKVEASITDSPILLGLLYLNEKNDLIKKSFERFIIESFRSQDNMTFLLKRVKEYNPNGRNQTLEESKVIDEKIETLLTNEGLLYNCVEGSNKGLQEVYEYVRKNLETRRRKYE
jgi:hypothetical protein